MARQVREVISDDLTGREIPGDDELWAATIHLALTPPKSDETPEPETVEFDATWDLSEIVAGALEDLVGRSDLIQFLRTTRVLVKIGPSDESEKVREWVRTAHPEMNVGERGRMGAEVWAAYRREVTLRANAGDANGATSPDDTDDSQGTADAKATGK